MNRRRICSWIIGLAAVLPSAAMAAEAYTTTAVNLRAGPDTEYPLVRWVPEGTVVEVYGCLADYRWCDVEVYGDRGWMSASYLVYPYQNSAVPIVTYGAVIGLPLIGFTFDSYWHDHYRGRPWYDNRQRWAYRHRPEYYPPHYESPRYSRPPPPQHRPPPQRPPQYHPPAARPPEFRPPQAQRPPLQQRPDIRPPQPAYRAPPQQSRPPSARPPEPARPPQVRGPAGPQTPQFERRMPSGRPSSGPTNEAGMTTGAF
jgi:uncharacterized protein YraI